jgi:hypothetical protein
MHLLFDILSKKQNIQYLKVDLSYITIDELKKFYRCMIYTKEFIKFDLTNNKYPNKQETFIFNEINKIIKNNVNRNKINYLIQIQFIYDINLIYNNRS